MRDILSNISILDSFLSTSEVKSSVEEAERLGLYPDQCEPYGTPDEPGDDDRLRAQW